MSASENLAGAAEYFPWRYNLNKMAAQFALEASDSAAAIQYLERPGTLSSLSYEDKLLLADAYIQDGDPFMAESIWKHLGEVKGSSLVYQRLVNLYLQRKDYSSATRELQNLLSLNPSDIPLYYQLGSFYAATDPLKALPYLNQAAEIDPVNASRARALHDKIRTANLYDKPAFTLLIAGRQLANTGNWELATVAFQHAIEIQPDYADAWAFLGEARSQVAVQESGSVSVAGLFELGRALQLEPDSTLANTFMGLYWERQDDYPKAQTYIRRAIDTSPDDPFLYSELGNILAKAGDLPAARSAYEKATSVNPNDPLFYRLMAEFALEYNIQLRELALPAARQAITLNPADPASLDVMAEVMIALQDYHSATRFLLDALHADPGYTLAYLHLGTAYLYLGESGLARQYLQLAQAINPQSWITDQVDRMLDYYFP